MTQDLARLLAAAADDVDVPPLDLDALHQAVHSRRVRRRIATALPVVMLLLAAPAAVALSARGGAEDRLSPAAPAPSASLPATPDAVLVPALRQVVQLTGQTFDNPAAQAQFGPSSVLVGKQVADDSQLWSMAVAFDPVAVPAGCIQRATLTLPPRQVITPPVDELSGAAEIRAYPSAALSLADGRLPPNGQAPTTLIDNRPVGLETVAPDGTRWFDVTELVRVWVAGGPFPSMNRTLPEGSPIVLLLRPPETTYGSWLLRFELAGQAPRLLVQASCGTDQPGGR